jgi:ABC-type branched-subunit amino acid transport system ATPase component
VEENLRIAGYLFSGADEKRLLAERTDYVFSLFPRLKERSSQMGGTLSGGEQKKLAISPALIVFFPNWITKDHQHYQTEHDQSGDANSKGVSHIGGFV